MQYKFGAHLSINGGHTNALKKIVVIGGTSLQIFSASPRMWNLAQIRDEDVKEFKLLKDKLKINSIYFHATYLINLASDGLIGERSIEVLINEMNLAKTMGVRGSIVHLGSFKGPSTKSIHNILIQNIRTVLDQTPEETLFIIENAGCRKIGQTIEEIGLIIKTVQSDRVRVCLDTCHLHASGYDLSTVAKLNEFLNKFDKLIGLNRLELWHVNDSRDGFGTLRDRHENIGEGKIGIDTFQNILKHQSLKFMPFIIETPGFDKKGPDKKNLDILKSIIL